MSTIIKETAKLIRPEDKIVYGDAGYEWIVDIDLKKFFDNVPQDKLMSYGHFYK